MRKICIALVLCQVVLSGFSQARRSVSQELVIPMDMTTRRPIVELTINDKGPYKFIFDTGSSTTVIDEGLSKELGFKTVGKDTLSVQGSENRMISQRVEVPNVAFPGTNISGDVEMTVVNLRAMLPIDGVLSGIFFKDYLFTVDYPGSKLTLTLGELDRSKADVSSIIENSNILSYNLIVDGIIIEAHLDTGSPGGFSLPYSMKDQLKLNGEMREGQEIRTPVASFKPWHANLIGNVNVGSVVYEDPEIKLVEGFEFANFGYEVLKDLRITIDRKNNLIKFEKPPAQKAAPDESVQKERLGDGETNDFTGTYGEDRDVYMEGGEMYLHRATYKFKLVKEDSGKDLYKMVYSVALNNELPNVRFDRDSNGKINGLTMVYEDGRETSYKKD